MVTSPRPGSGPGSPYPSHLPSPTSSSSTSTTPTPMTRSDSNLYPTTFVQADTTSFKQVVQMLTGSPKPNPNPNPIPPIKPNNSTKPKPSSKLYERRNSLKNTLRISPLFPSGFGLGSPRTQMDHSTTTLLSPSMLHFPSLVLSPVTPLIPDPFNRSPGPGSGLGSGIVVNKNAEDQAIADKGFYLHPSPVSTPRGSEPKLLPLFPVTSPRVSSSGSDR